VTAVGLAFTPAFYVVTRGCHHEPQRAATIGAAAGRDCLEQPAGRRLMGVLRFAYSTCYVYLHDPG
jgi:hypothetical protein